MGNPTVSEMTKSVLRRNLEAARKSRGHSADSLVNGLVNGQFDHGNHLTDGINPNLMDLLTKGQVQNMAAILNAL